ncbi:hypothetical protein DOTSEDRAFT_51841 [Dothistroma septosporum NZE10]|uniref:Rhodopsin domain-containing protein n=1 Tax=Dothistroma septosporum (strain NZE10 / CBS 128990) TaxID=675120 RepID=N1PSG9_DOTSN|nr:hypothetical protein DOTSEDRAFT_51841 [Dothistroma septosporum NZE10]
MTLPNGDLSAWLQKQVVEPHKFDTFSMTQDRLALIVVGVIFTLVGTFAIACRIMMLMLRRRIIGNDDFAMFVGYAFAIAFTIASYASVRWGVGLELVNVPPFWAKRAVRAIYVEEIFYYFSVFFVKISIMFMYLRLAKELRNYFYHCSIAMIAVLCVQFGTTIIVFSAQCIPLTRYWSPEIPGNCIDITAFFYSTNFFTIITDVIMLALPIPVLLKVPGSRLRKAGVIAAFSCGGFSTLASCVRLYSIRIYTQSPQPLRDAAPINTWSLIEVYVGICCGSIAVVKQFVLASRERVLTSSPQRSVLHKSSLSTSATSPTPGSSFGSSIRKASSIRRTVMPIEADEMCWWSGPSNGIEPVLEAGSRTWLAPPRGPHDPPTPPNESYAPRDIDGQSIRISSPLPPSPSYQPCDDRPYSPSANLGDVAPAQSRSLHNACSMPS